TYKPFGDTTYRYEKLKAIEICEQVLQQKDFSEGKINCFNLLNDIKSKALYYNVEKVNIPEQPSRVLVKYKNIESLFLRFLKANDSLQQPNSSQADDKFWSALIKEPPFKNWQQKLPATNDYQEHGVEIKVEGLPPGEYILMASDSQDFAD